MAGLGVGAVASSRSWGRGRRWGSAKGSKLGQGQVVGAVIGAGVGAGAWSRGRSRSRGRDSGMHVTGYEHERFLNAYISRNKLNSDLHLFLFHFALN